MNFTILRRFTILRFAACVMLLLCCVASAARAQQPEQDEVIDVESRLVQLNIGVSDRRGQPITNLTAADFAVYEDGAPQKITSFEPVTTPFSLVLLLDLSGSTQSFRQTLKQSAIRFLDALAPGDRIAVVVFNREARTLVEFTNDRRKIAYAIEIAEGRTPQTELYAALQYSLKQLARETNRRKAIVVMTDGVDTSISRLDRQSAAAATTPAEAAASVKLDADARLPNVLNMADRQGVTIYPLALPSGDIKRIRAPNLTQVAVYTAARGRLETLTTRTGGRIHDIRRLEDMGRLYAEVAADMRTLYSISYQPTSAATPPPRGTWRPIRIEVTTRTGLLARTREGYFSR